MGLAPGPETDASLQATFLATSSKGDGLWIHDRRRFGLRCGRAGTPESVVALRLPPQNLSLAQFRFM